MDIHLTEQDRKDIKAHAAKLANANYRQYPRRARSPIATKLEALVTKRLIDIRRHELRQKLGLLTPGDPQFKTPPT